MRQFEARWFRSASDTEHRFLIRSMKDYEITARLGMLAFLDSLSLLSSEHWLERYRLIAEEKSRRDESFRKERCPICGGW